jgi:dihydroorotase
MTLRTRRVFLGQALSGALAFGLAAPLRGFAKAQDPSSPRYDLLIKGGKVIDPSQNLSANRDVAISGTKIVKVAEGIPAAEARQVLDASGKVVTPGLIDAHVHVYDGVAPVGIPADPNCLAKGVTTVLDAGSAGANTFPAFRKLVIETANTRVYALLNISVFGQSSYSLENPYGELLDLHYVNPKLAIRTIEQNRDILLGVKIRLSRFVAADRDLKVLALAKEATDAVKLPLMVHIGDTHSPLSEILLLLGKGDVVTHCFHRTNGILDGKGQVLPEVKAAVARGVHLDVGHGGGSFSFDVAERALQQGVLPYTISSDVHRYNFQGPVFDLATTLSKFVHLGLTLEQVIERATANPVNVFNFPKGLGTLAEGAEADVAIFTLAEGDFTFADSYGQRRIGKRKLEPAATVKAGKRYEPASNVKPEPRKG